MFKYHTQIVYPHWERYLRNVECKWTQCPHPCCSWHVYKVNISNSYTDISAPENINDFVKESILMLGFDHPNVLKLLGVCFDTDDNLPLIVLPYMANGDLRSFLMSKRNPSVSVSYAVFPQVNILSMY